MKFINISFYELLIIVVFILGLKGFRAEELSYEESVKMHEYATKTLKQKSIIIDADDIMRDPGNMRYI